MNDKNPNDGTIAVQYTIDFYEKNGRDYYLRNKNLLESKKLDLLQDKITRTINSGNLNTPENHSGKREFGKDILSFLNELNSQTLKIK